MPLVFAGITPHAPILLPSIGKEKAEDSLEKTLDGPEQLARDLYIAKPDIIIMISPHQGVFEDTFSINAASKYTATYEQFGDLSTTHHWHGAPMFVEALSTNCHKAKLPTRFIANETLDHGSSVPLFFMTEHLKDTRIVPIGFSQLSTKAHLQFGQFLQSFIQERPERIAVIASGDLSHCLTKNSPAPHDKEGAFFDKRLMQMLETKNTVGVLTMDEKMIEAAQECGYRSILILLGILSEINYQFKRYSYEYPFGVGYLVGNCELP